MVSEIPIVLVVIVLLLIVGIPAEILIPSLFPAIVLPETIAFAATLIPAPPPPKNPAIVEFFTVEFADN